MAMVLEKTPKAGSDGHLRGARINNFHTGSQGRVASTRDLTPKQLDDLLRRALPHMEHSEAQQWDANINGIIVRLVTNSAHQMDFWMDNWWPGPNNESTHPHGFLYSVNGVPNMEPHAYYCPDRDTAVFINTEYYGQCKSWALGIAAKVLEQKFHTHSIHGACAMVEGKGVVIIAPTGTGKTTQVNRLFQHPQGKVVGDDWIYIKHPAPGQEDGFRFEVNQPERRLYVRTENAKEERWLAPIFDRCKLENVVEDPAKCMHEKGEPCGITDGKDSKCYWGFANARAILPREWMLGPQKVGDRAPMDLIVLLRRDHESPAEQVLSPDQAIAVLKEGRTMIRPGAGPKEKWGTYGSEPWYNPYLLQPDHLAQERFFRAEMANAKTVIINTGAPGESIQRTRDRILQHLLDGK
jgi:hypothetical protein